MSLIDRPRTVAALQPGPSGARLRFGTVVSNESDRTCTVQIGGSSPVTGVKYASHVVPLPGAGCVLAADGTDLFILGTLAAAGRTLAPRAYRDTDQTLTDATDTAVTFAGANSDAWTCWASGQATRLTAPLSGRYTATGWVKFATNATGLRSGWIYRSGATEYGRVTVPAASGSPTQLTITTPAFDMTKDDYIQLYVRQTSGGNLALTRDTNVTPALTLTYLGP